MGELIGLAQAIRVKHAAPRGKGPAADTRSYPSSHIDTLPPPLMRDESLTPDQAFARRAR
jgi:hypothetical protein